MVKVNVKVKNMNFRLRLLIGVMVMCWMVGVRGQGVTLERLPEVVNSPFSEYNPLLVGDTLFYFSSMRSEVDDDNELFFDTHWSSRIYQAYCSEGNYYGVKTLPVTINKSRYYHPNFCFNKSRDYMVFSRCYRTADEELVCNLYESRLKNGKWGKAQALGNGINGPGFSTTQPFLAELDDYAVLYFVSNRPNGQGEMDIWFSVYKNGQYEIPINAGSGVNTAGNEVTPFYDVVAGILYFSSDEWPGKGGYDIFNSQGGLCSWTPPQNLGTPLNSEENDIYFSVNADGQSGYLSSNRIVDPEHIEDTCCNDLYRWEATEPEKKADTTLAPQDSGLLAIKGIFPLNLYFDNDQPNPRTIADTTSLRYLSLNRSYCLEKTAYLNKAENEVERQWMEAFFDDSLVHCRSGVLALMVFLDMRLAQGQQVTLSIEGYASQLHEGDYNRHLSQRRIVSLLNELKEYSNGLLKKYIERGQLKIKELPFGSSMAGKIQGDSVFGRQAVLQRKIVVWDIEVSR